MVAGDLGQQPCYVIVTGDSSCQEVVVLVHTHGGYHEESQTVLIAPPFHVLHQELLKQGANEHAWFIKEWRSVFGDLYLPLHRAKTITDAGCERKGE